ncbi:MAG: type II toxin-antitoxin system RelE/ParE family toxin [Parvibaculaceae bacterium]
MVEVLRSQTFADWLNGLKDNQARLRVNARIIRLEAGNMGDTAPVGEGVSELRIHYGPGYRVYFVQRGAVILLCGGDKSTQPADTKRAKRMARDWRG